MVSSAFRVLLADDEAVMDGESIRDAVERALLHINPRMTITFETVDVLQSARQKLVSDAVVDLALIDVIWNSRSFASASKGDGAHDLVTAALARTETAVLLISQSEGLLTSWMFAPERRDFRPHAAMHKDAMLSVRTVAGAIEAAFSVAGLPLRSRGTDFTWEREGRLVVPDDDHMRIVVEELACAALGPSPNVRICPVSGGFSGASTFIVASLSTAGNRVEKTRLLKISQNARVLRTEEKNNVAYLDSFPAGRFPELDNVRCYFAGWAGLVFRVVGGSTAASRLDLLAEPAIWSRVFGRELWYTVADQAEIVRSSFRAVMSESADAPMTTSRWARFRKVVEEDLRVFVPGLVADDGLYSRLLPETATRMLLGTVHGDLHSRNVLIDRGDRPMWIDAGSVRPRGLWCSDLARFAVWSSCQFLSASEFWASALNGSTILFSLGLKAENEEEFPAWAHSLRGCVDAELSAASQVFVEKGHLVEIDRDWRVAVGVELARASYSRDFFDVWVRACSATAALRSVRVNS